MLYLFFSIQPIASDVCDMMNPCSNGGICSHIPGDCDRYVCTCSNCRTGDNCEIGKYFVKLSL